MTRHSMFLAAALSIAVVGGAQAKVRNDAGALAAAGLLGGALGYLGGNYVNGPSYGHSYGSGQPYGYGQQGYYQQPGYYQPQRPSYYPQPSYYGQQQQPYYATPPGYVLVPQSGYYGR